MFGALSTLWLGDRLGRRKTIALGGIIMIIGAILQTTSFSYAQMVVARIITGLGNGLNASVSSKHALCSMNSVLLRTDFNSTCIPCRMLPRLEQGQLHYARG